jgi:glucose/arabinose dehydrogenase/PKD repeat protein
MKLLFQSACIGLIILICIVPKIEAVIFNDPGFTEEGVFNLPPFTLVGVTFAPDGRIFAWQRTGIVRIYKNGSLLPTPFLNISSQVNIAGDRGMLGLTLDPDFSNNGYVYLLYVYENAGTPNSTAPRTSRLTRVTADPNNPDVMLPGSEVVLAGSIGTPPCSDHPAGSDCIPADHLSHSIGQVIFAPDGTMFFGNGDGSSYDFADPRALRTYDLSSFSGKILRINPDGTAPSDNPFYDGTDSVQSKVWAYGLRNPFRFGLDPELGEPLIGDVGWNDHEELNRGRGANFGWPCFEGISPQPAYQAAFIECQQMDPNTITDPIYHYDHSQGASVTGGVFYTADEYPAQYQGNYFFGDYVGSWIRRVVFDADHNIVEVKEFATDTQGPVQFTLGPDGFLYYIALGIDQLRRIRFNGPFANASATPTFGYSPLNVDFSSAGSFDPNGQSLTFLWDFDDGNTSTQPNPIHIYTSGSVQTYDVSLTVTNEDGDTSQDFVSITIGSVPPIATINNPIDGTHVVPGDVINFDGSGSDPDDGSLPPGSLKWTVLLHHNTHHHTFLEQTGSSGSFVVQDNGVGTFSYVIILTVTDSSGLTNSTSVELPVDQQPPGCVFCDDFEDGVLATNWQYLKGIWIELNGFLQVTTNKQATTIATPAFSGCATCSLTVDVQTAGGRRNKILIFGWYVDKDNRVEVIMQEKKDKWVLKQRSSGVVVAKKTSNLPILPNTTYTVQVTFDGTTFALSIDGVQLFTMPKAAGTLPNGTVGFQVKDTTGLFGSIDVQ